ncbi:hypothetical protein LCGC14_0341110 [marine sediment metagenome]|uniref:Macrocin O-methyltransferase n=1 Tax=marine sediment metagenome TaxID=412755 RepID=A0A0F9TJ96_9ZZZZ
MPLRKAQGILKKVLSEKAFNELYKVACNGFDVYQSILDKIYYGYPIKDYDEWVKRRRLGFISPFTMTSRVGLIATYDVVKEAVQKQIKGSFVECGVARGGCSALMAIIARNERKGRETWLFDSFEGLPKQTEVDGIQKPVRHKGKTSNDLAEGYCLGTYEEVYNLMFEKLGLDCNEVVLVKGWFQETLSKNKSRIGQIAVLRLDGDWYESTKCCLESLYDNVVEGGYVIIDDYQLAGCKLAVDEFFKNRKLDVIITNDADGRGYWIK